MKKNYLSKEMFSGTGDRIKYIREQLGLKQHELASKTGVSASFVSFVEKGNKKPSFELLSSLQSIFHVNINWIISGQGKPFNTNGSQDKSTLLRQLYPNLPEDSNIDDLIESLQVPIMCYSMIAQYLLLEKQHRNFIESFLEEQKNEGKSLKSV